MIYTTEYPLGPPRRRRWGFIRWWFSLLILIPLLGVAVFFAWGMIFSGSDIEGRVIDAYSGDPVSGAQVEFGEAQDSTGDNGEFGFSADDSATAISVSRDGYDSANHQLSDQDEEIEIQLRPTTLSGTVTDRITEEPLEGITVEAVVDGDVASSAETGDDGSYRLTDVPEGAEIVFDSADYAEVTETIDQRAEISATLRPDVVTGKVTDQNGDPVQWATIAVGVAWTESGGDGSFRLEGAPESGEIVVKAPGYRAETMELDDQLSLDVSLESKEVRAIYVTAAAVSDEQRFTELLDLVERTELNAMVIDIKDSTGQIFYDSDVPLANEIGAVQPAYDVGEILAKVKERGIYAIARQVIFEDPKLAEAQPELAIQDANGEIWRTWNDVPWLSAYEEDVWEYNIDLMMEAVELGFDEIQYDYVRFPSDGPLDEAEYDVDVHDSASRREAISGFLARSHEEIMPTRAYLAADIFGLTLWETGGGGIGQNLEDITPHLDYINPMIYPSHFFEGSMGFDVPNDHPYEVILYSLQNARERIPQFADKLRPWLQDFSYGEGREYGPQEVRDQIDASNEFGAPGWMLWNASSSYQEDALDPATE